MFRPTNLSTNYLPPPSCRSYKSQILLKAVNFSNGPQHINHHKSQLPPYSSAKVSYPTPLPLSSKNVLQKLLVKFNDDIYSQIWKLRPLHFKLWKESNNISKKSFKDYHKSFPKTDNP